MDANVYTANGNIRDLWRDCLFWKSNKHERGLTTVKHISKSPTFIRGPLVAYMHNRTWASFMLLNSFSYAVIKSK